MTLAFKADENLHPEVAGFLCANGHDALTVWDQRLRGASDADIAAVCRAEGRVIVTADQGFANIRPYPPAEYAGIIVLRLSRQIRSAVLNAVARLLPLLASERLPGSLWVVDEHQVRIRTGGGPGDT